MAVGMQKVMGVSGAESLNVAASIFMDDGSAADDQTVHRGLTESELFTIMTSAWRTSRAQSWRRTLRLRGFDRAPADGGDHDGAGDHHVIEDLHSRDRETGDRGQSGCEDREDGGEHHRRGGRRAREMGCTWR